MAVYGIGSGSKPAIVQPESVRQVLPVIPAFLYREGSIAVRVSVSDTTKARGSVGGDNVIHRGSPRKCLKKTAPFRKSSEVSDGSDNLSACDGSDNLQ